MNITHEAKNSATNGAEDANRTRAGGGAMKDYRVTVKIQNNILLKMMSLHGYETAADLSRASGIDQSRLGQILNLQTPAYNEKGLMPASVERLCEFFICYPEDIFPQQHLYQSLPTNKAETEASLEDLLPAAMLESQENPLLGLEAASVISGLLGNLDALPEMQSRVLKMRFGLDDGQERTLREIGKTIGRSADRVRQIEAKGLRNLRKSYAKSGGGSK